MKNIAIVIPSLSAGGAEKQAALLAVTLQKSYHVDIFLLHGIDSISPQNRALLEGSDVAVHALCGTMLFKLCQLRRELKRRGVDVLFNYLTSCNVVGAIAGRMAGVKRIYGGIRNTRVEWSKMVADRFIHNHVATGSIYNCYSGAEYFTSKGYKATRNIVIPNCFMNIAEPMVRADREVKHIVTVGRFVPQKDYRTLIRTIASLRALRKEFVVDIVGYGEQEQNIVAWINEFGVEDSVNIYIKPDNVQDILRDADIYLSTSLFEGTSNSIMEAMNWSLPVVATDVGDNSHLIADGVSGMLHPIGDAEGMAQSLARLIDSADMRNSMGANGNNNLHENYTMELFEQRYVDLIES
mgnify:FL=1